MKKIFILLTVSGLFIGFAGTGYAKTVTILYSGETHAALEHCNCPIAPNGGLRRRASVAKDARRLAEGGEILLLDTGGIFAGGIYDENISGPGPDRRRTEFTMKATRKLGYNAVAVSDEELAYGKEYLLRQKDLFLSANVLDAKTGRPLLTPYKIFHVQGVRIGVIGLSPPPPKGAAGGIRVGDPMTAAREAVANLRPNVDVVILLSPLGETKSKELLQQIPGIDILLNGDEYNTNQVYQQVAGKHFFQFFFQGRSMGRIDIGFDDANKINDINANQIALSDEIPDDPEMNAMLDAYYEKEKAAGDKQVKLDLYLMSHNPNDREVLAALAPLFKDGKMASMIDWDINFIADITPDGTIRSPRGPEEILENMRQLLIARYAPDVFWDYISCTISAFPGTPWQECLGKSAKQIEEKIASGEGLNLLGENIRHTQSMRIKSSPTVFVNNNRYRDHIHTLAFLKNFCDTLDPEGSKFTDCKRLPECFDDNDCSKPNRVGVCMNKGRREATCTYERAVDIKLTVLYDAKTMTGEVDQVINVLKKTTPGMREERIDYQTDKGRDWISGYGVTRIPAYFYDQNLPKVKRFDQIRELVIRKGDYYLLRPRRVGGNRYIRRNLIPRRIDIFTSPLDPMGNNAIRGVMAFLKELPKPAAVTVSFHHVLLNKADDLKNHPLGLAEEEEALRRIALEIYHPKLLYPYLVAWSKRMGSGYWEDSLDDVWLVPQQIKAQSKKEEVRKKLEESRRLLEGIEMNQAVVFLINNQEVVLVRNFDDFKRIYQNLSQSPE